MKRFLIGLLGIFFIASAQEDSISELLDEAQTSIKVAIESNCEIKAPYKCAKARTYYEIAKEEVSKLNISAGEIAAKKAIHWALMAISESNRGIER